MEEVLKDERFSHILTDPRFRKIPKNVRKIKVDNRFKNLFKSKNFKEKCRVDERGRSLNLEPSENLQKLYNLDEETNDSDTNLEEESNVINNKRREKISKKKKINVDISLNKNDEEKSSSHLINKKETLKNKKSNKKNSEKQLRKNSSDQSHYSNRDDEDVTPTFTDEEESYEQELDENSHKADNSTQVSKEKKKVTKKNKTRSEKKCDARFILNKEFDEERESENSEEDAFGKANLKNVNSDEEPESEKSEEESELSSSEEESDDTDSEDSGSDKSDSFDHQWEEQHERAPDADEITKRLAVCNMDWDRIRAEDLYVVFNSFKPVDTSILSVKIYPSEFGLKRMEEEKLKGPPELVEKTLDPDEEEDEENEDKKGGRYNREKLRQYQMNRLKYYYAIVECDSPETANSLYEQLNGMEYESSSVRFDLRYVPDDMIFDQEPTSTANNAPDLSEYKPRLFVTTALQQVKVGLTWDETDPHRRETLQKAFTEADSIESDIKHYLASSSESEDEIAEEENSGVKLSSKERIQKFRELLESINDQEKEKDAEKYEMEITWESGVKEKTETLVKEKLEEKTYTPFEELQKKKKEKQKLKKKQKKTKTDQGEESGDNLSDESDSDISQETNSKGERSISKKSDELYLISDAKKLDDELQKSKKKKKKKNKVKESNDDIKVDINDPRFSAIYTSPLFNIDPSDPHFKDTPGNLAIIAEKQRRLKNKAAAQDGPSKKFKYN